MSNEIVRASTGQFVKGKSGNPRGRPKGRKNQLSILREAVRQGATQCILEHFPRLVDKVIEQADKGEEWAIKLLWKEIMEDAKSVEKNKGKGGVEVKIVIESAAPKPIDAEDVDVIEVDEDNERE